LHVRRLAGKMSIFEINIAVFPHPCIVNKGTSLYGNICNWSIIQPAVPYSEPLTGCEDLEVKEEKDRPNEDWFSLVDALFS